MNLLQSNDIANILVTGYASARAHDEFKKYGEPFLVAPVQEGTYRIFRKVSVDSLPKSNGI
jgi:hypothetical protein